MVLFRSKAEFESLMLPELFVFDLDDTVWSGDVDCWYRPPFKTDMRHANTALPLPVFTGVVDSVGERLVCFPDALAILHWIQEQGLRFAFASRTTAPKHAQQALSQLFLPRRGAAPGGERTQPHEDKRYGSLASLASHMAWGDCDKKKHLTEVASRCGVDLQKMLFFDNEKRNIASAKRLGVPSCYCPGGLTWQVFNDALEDYKARY